MSEGPGATSAKEGFSEVHCISLCPSRSRHQDAIRQRCIGGQRRGRREPSDSDVDVSPRGREGRRVGVGRASDAGRLGQG